MKNIVHLLVVTLLFVACEDALEEAPVDQIAREAFYTSADDAQAAIFAVYDPLRNTDYYGARLLGHLEVLAEYANGRGSYRPVSEYQGLDAVNTGRTENMWQQMYSSINRANAVIGNVPSIVMDETEKNAIVAEAHFLRALNYYNLVRGWGGVPLRTEETIDLSNQAAPRATVDQVYELIVDDLEIAERGLPAEQDEIGRATQWAAKTLLAEVYLTREQWDLSRDKAQEVISSNQFTLVAVQEPDDFSNLFGPEIISSSEEIFSLKYTRVDGQGFWFLSFIHLVQAGYSAAGFRVVLGIPDLPFYTEWDDNDLRKEHTIYTSYVDAQGDSIPLPDNEPMLFRKFRDPEGVSPVGHGNDFPVLRYADALLIYAEAASQASGGPTAEAYGAINQIRRRAYGLDASTSAPSVDLSGLDAATFRDAVLQERAREFVAEGRRWWDLKRTGRARAVIEATGKEFNDIMLLWPIPLAEIDNNPAISSEDQNPGY
ncbi:MAG: RagB/SusD family nutrient uptake outer membrane protein [Tunicatimonas sp.]|uniref:RagB/SusD family nutrient uptake outer membrane protein n=1 Tax=Tunicatimonas sp. TaxID=1940096 RepID=UPI003C708A91